MREIETSDIVNLLVEKENNDQSLDQTELQRCTGTKIAGFILTHKDNGSPDRLISFFAIDLNNRA